MPSGRGPSRRGDRIIRADVLTDLSAFIHQAGT
jgi:hypothetical protein